MWCLCLCWWVIQVWRSSMSCSRICSFCNTRLRISGTLNPLILQLCDMLAVWIFHQGSTSSLFPGKASWLYKEPFCYQWFYWITSGWSFWMGFRETWFEGFFFIVFFASLRCFTQLFSFTFLGFRKCLCNFTSAFSCVGSWWGLSCL